MIPIINASLFENPFYTVTPINQPTAQISYIDFAYSPTSSNTFTNSPSNLITISPTFISKIIKVKQLIIPLNPYIEPEPFYLYNIIKNEINKDYFNRITVLGEQHRKLDLNFDIIIREIEKTTHNVGRVIINRLNMTNSYIASQGRIGPAHWITANKKTYNMILSYLKNEDLVYNQSMIPMIGNIPFIINDAIADDIILIGRKNDIKQPGVHCFILVNEQKNIEFQEISNMSIYNTNLVLYYALEEFGNQPFTQYMKIDTENLASKRYKKLKRIESL
jgi:hypothetical protein